MNLVFHSWYSLRYGTLSVSQIVELGARLGYSSLVFTDINNSTGSLEFVKECAEKSITPVLGVEFMIGDKWLYTGIAKNENGFSELNEMLTHHNLSGEDYPENPPELNDVFFVFPFSEKRRKIKANEWIGVNAFDAAKLLMWKKEEREKCIFFHRVTYANMEGYQLHRRLRAIHHNTLLSKIPEQKVDGIHSRPVSKKKIEAVFNEYSEILERTEKLFSACSFFFDFKPIKNKKTFTGSAYDDKFLLEKLAFDGMKFRYGTANKIARERVKKELEIIDKLGFSSYFLITWDIIRYSMSRGFYHVGRGSGANSVVAYCLMITDVCPIELDLYFERFLNPKRKSPPDFDIDYSWKERDDVLDYIFKRYGRKHTALLGAMSTFKDRSIVRELGKVYGLPKSEIDALANNPEAVKQGDTIAQEILRYGTVMQDFPNLRTIHAGGVLISDEPISHYSALDLPPKGFPTTQFDMYLAEDIGFEKLDILSQRGIGHIKEAAEIILKNKGVKVDVHDVKKFKQDKRVKEQLHSGDTIGCFYIESPAMRGLLKKLHCDNYLTLVAASSIIRPGVAKSGMMKEYIHRFHHPDKFQYLHPVLEEQLKETYGVMVYQEDVLKVGHHFGGLDLADADVLRRMMSGKGRNKKHLEEIREKYFKNCKDFGYSESIAAEVWRQIESFAGYSFSKAHSASYAVESFQSLYLKTYYPKEFMVAVINNFGGFYATWVYVNEAKKAGAIIELPCVNKSTYNTTIYGDTVYLGFVHVGKLEQQVAKEIEVERNRNGDYLGFEDFVRRTHITLEQLLILVRINAIRFSGYSKKELLWQAHLLLGKNSVAVHEPEMFYEPAKTFTLPALEAEPIEDVYDEMEIIGFPVTKSFFDLLEKDYKNDMSAANLTKYVGQTIRILGNYVTQKWVGTSNGKLMSFGTWLDRLGNFFDTTHFPKQLQQYPFKGSGVYMIEGKVIEEFGFPSIEVSRMGKLAIKRDPRNSN
jgi:error-prone DNA polymerase